MNPVFVQYTDVSGVLKWLNTFSCRVTILAVAVSSLGLKWFFRNCNLSTTNNLLDSIKLPGVM